MVAKASVVYLHHAGVGGEERGQFHHRVARPCAAIAVGGAFETAQANWFDAGALDAALAADVLVLQGMTGAEAQGLRIARAARGRVTLFEISDDPLTARPWMGRTDAADPVLIRQVMEMAARCDGVQFSSEGLRARYGGWNRVHTVLPNIVDLPPATGMRPRDGGPVIGWAGTFSHGDDLAAVAPAVKAVLDAHPASVFAFKGDVRLGEMFRGLDHRVRHEPFGDYAEYVAFLGGLDIGIVPLGASRFNIGRTDVKAVEMAAAGAAVVVQDAPAYAALPACFPRFADGAGLVALLDGLVRDPARRRAVSRQARDWVLSHRRPEQAAALHLDWYRARAPEASGRGLPDVVHDAERAKRFMSVAREIARGDAAGFDRLRALHAEDPDHVQSRWMLGRTLAVQGDTDAARRVLAPLGDHPVYASLPFLGTVIGR